MKPSQKIEIIRGDITCTVADVIVNAANPSLLGGGGVDGAIHKAGGSSIIEECRIILKKQGECKTGNAVITGAGKLPAKFVIHTVGPVWHGGCDNEDCLLADCYTNALKLAVNNNCRIIAFPNISTGVYRFPKERAAGIAVKTVSDFLSKHATIEKAIFVCFDDGNLREMQTAFSRILLP
jgi:O-acetyl-ADP-ribose deacetylase (regulator of RNase III)